MNHSVIRTPRLLLIAATEQHVRAELDALETFRTLIDADVPASWPPGQYDRDAQEFFLQALVDGGTAAIGWFGWYALHWVDGAHRATLIGCGGYLGPPSPDGTAEIGYSVCSEWCGRGFATEMAKALAQYAARLPEVRRVIAHTHHNNHASVATLLRSGFTNSAASDQPDTLLFEWGDVPAKQN
ncbi:MAG: GNAT family N-acetyltransferase [Gemmatimonadaceae bacterium]